MSALNDDEILKELKIEAAKWVIKTLPERMSGVGVDEVEVRNQLNIEADRWVQYNFDQRRQIDGCYIDRYQNKKCNLFHNSYS